MNTVALSPQEAERYAAHLALCELDIPGVSRLRSARVLVCGAGALASPSLLYLAAAGVGTLGIADGDVVGLSNLQRQIIHSTEALGRPKTASAAERIASLNPGVTVVTHPVMLTESNVDEIIKGYDLLLDCTDNYPTRILLSRAARRAAKPLCFAGVSRFQAQVMTQLPDTAGYDTLFPNAPTAEQTACNSCANAGVFNATAGLAGTMQASEAIKWITGAGDLLVNRLLMVDLLTNDFKTINIPYNK